MVSPTLVVVSGYFSPLHCGHLDYLEAGATLGDRLLVIVNNDVQHILKKGKVILPEKDRLRLVQALTIVDEACIATDSDSSVKETIAAVAIANPKYRLIFGNGGDRNIASDIPEALVCNELNIEMAFGIGGTSKRDSSSRINNELGIE